MQRRVYRLAELAERFGGVLAGTPDAPIERVASLAGAGPGAIAFFTGSGRGEELAATRAGAVILAERDAARFAGDKIIAPDPYLYFALVSQLLNPPSTSVPGVHPTAVVAASARIDESASIGAHVAIGEATEIGANAIVGAGTAIGARCSIGEGARLAARVTVYDDVRIGARSIVHSGAVLGADGFGFAPQAGRWVKIPQIAGLSIGMDVEIGANTCIDRGALDDTVIEDGVKLDNLIQIGHNCRIGAHTAIAGCVGIAGSTTIGRHCMIGGAAMIAGHLTIADRVVIAGGTLVSRSIDTAGPYAGPFPFDEQRRWQRTAVHVRNLDALVERIKALEKAAAHAPGNKNRASDNEQSKERE